MIARLSSKTFVLCLFALAGLLAYSNIINSFFLSDDFALLGKVLQGHWSVTWGLGHGGFFRPVFILSCVADAAIWGRNPFGFHLTNLILHILNAFLVWRLALSLARDSNLDVSHLKRFSLVAGLIFLVHPAHTEAVTWISGRIDLLASVFCLAAFLFFINYARNAGRVYLLASLITFTLGLLSKELTVCLPLLVFLTGVYLRRTSGLRPALKQSFKLILPFICVVILFVFVRAMVLGTLIGGYGADQHLNFSHGIVISQFLRFFLRLIFPTFLLRRITFLESRALSPILIAFGVIVIIVIAVVLRRPERRRALIASAKRNVLPGLSLILSLVCFLPAINLRLNIFTTQGERFLYLPSAFFAIAMAYLIARATRGKKRVWAVLVVSVLAIYAGSLWMTNQTWREASMLSRTILDDVVRQSSRDDSVLMLNIPDNLRDVYVFRNGFEEAIKSFQDSKPLSSSGIVAYQDLVTSGDEIKLNMDGDEVDLLLTNPRTAFHTKIETANPCVAIVESSRDFLRVRLQQCGQAYDAFVVSSGRAIKVGETR